MGYTHTGCQGGGIGVGEEEARREEREHQHPDLRLAVVVWRPGGGPLVIAPRMGMGRCGSLGRVGGETGVARESGVTEKEGRGRARSSQSSRWDGGRGGARSVGEWRTGGGRQGGGGSRGVGVGRWGNERGRGRADSVDLPNRTDDADSPKAEPGEAAYPLQP
jgi:hypothetical protein